MKKYLILIILSVSAAMIHGCTQMSEEMSEATLTVSSTSLWFDAEGGRQMIEISTYAGSWTVSMSDGSDWCTSDKTSGTTSSSFYVETVPNGGQQRETTLTVSAPGCKDVIVTVTQNGEADEQLSWTPETPEADSPLVITYKPVPESDLYDYTGDLYAYIGVVDGDFWRFTPADYNTNAEKAKFNHVGDNTWTLELTPTIREWFDAGTAEVSKIGLIIRSEDMGREAFEEDVFIEVTDGEYTLVHQAPVEEAVPDNLPYGINYSDDGTQVTFVLAAADINGARNYDFCYLIGEFNGWQPSLAYAMKWDQSRGAWWYTLSLGDPDGDPSTDDALDPEQEYMFQYYIGKTDDDTRTMRVSDPFTEIVYCSDDQYISSSTYPMLPEFPAQQTSGLVSAFCARPAEYSWQNDGFRIEDKNDLVIYELLFRDFSASGDIKGAMEHLDYLENLGINAIELMPIQEFDGNDSWGYAPNSYFAMDKAYGTREMYKQFIDECHGRGIAVIVDVVYNHLTGSSTLAKLYWNDKTDQTADNNPWFNVTAPHPFSVYHDLRHDVPFVRDYVKRSLEYLLEEYHVDGFRFDLTKGFTQNDQGDASRYNSERIGYLTEYYNFIQSVNPDAVMILEHFCNGDEEKELASRGMQLWSNLNNAYCQSAMGYRDNSEFWNLYTGTNGNGVRFGGYVGFMESHDEERTQFKAVEYGQTSVKDDLEARMKRGGVNAAFFLTVPGPKMIWQFGELGYDYSIEYNNRTGRKPVRWDYYEDPYRKGLYDNYSKLLAFRRDNPEFFDEGVNFSWQVGYDNWTNGRTITSTASDGRTFVVVGNFDTEARRDFVEVPAGEWKDYFTGESYGRDASGLLTVELGAGEYRLLVNF